MGIEYPTLEYNEETSHYDVLCCALSYDGNDYNHLSGPVPPGDFKYCNYEDWTNQEFVGTPSAITDPEPQALVNVVPSGTNNITVLLISGDPGGGMMYITTLCEVTQVVAVIANLPPFLSVDLTINDVFIANGAGLDFTFAESAIAAASATLWGGDGAGGERTTPSDDSIDTRFRDRRDKFQDGATDNSWNDDKDDENARIQNTPPYVDYGKEPKRGLGDEIKTNPIKNSPEEKSKR